MSFGNVAPPGDDKLAPGASDGRTWNELMNSPFGGASNIRRVVTDYTGTLSLGGRLSTGVEDRLRRLKNS